MENVWFFNILLIYGLNAYSGLFYIIILRTGRKYHSLISINNNKFLNPIK